MHELEGEHSSTTAYLTSLNSNYSLVMSKLKQKVQAQNVTGLRVEHEVLRSELGVSDESRKPLRVRFALSLCELNDRYLSVRHPALCSQRRFSLVICGTKNKRRCIKLRSPHCDSPTVTFESRCQRCVVNERVFFVGFFFVRVCLRLN